MDEYLLGRQVTAIRDVIENKELIQKYSDKLFINERPDSEFNVKGLNIHNCTFASIGFKKSKFDQFDLAHCIFIECYFKKSYLQNTNFTACKFINCNFEDCTFVSCDFSYAMFQNCIIDFDILHYNLPGRHNVRWKLCTNLALESLRIGNDEEYRKYYFEEKKSSEKHYLQMFLKPDDYYKNHYSSWESFVGLLKFTGSKMSKYLWGYGEKLSYLITNMMLVILAFTFLYLFSGPVFKINEINSQRQLRFFECLYLSICNFLTINSDITTYTSFLRASTAIEGFVGILLMGFFVAALFRYINRR